MKIEAERYELHNTEPAYHFEIDLELGRRGFLQLAGGGILIMMSSRTTEAQQESGRGGRGGQAAPKDVSAWLHIGEDGVITACTGKVEIGQGIRTSLAQVVAEELHAPLSSIRLIMGDTDLVPYDMGTFGSQTTPRMAPQLRKAAAAAREMLIDLAAKQLNVDRATLSAVDGKVGSLSFAQLTKGQQLVQQIRDDAKTAPAAEWKVAGKPAPKAGGREIVTGKHTYTPDVQRPGMLYGKILRPDAFGSILASVDATAAEKMHGVKVVRDGDFVGVVASSEHLASKALAAIQAEWKPKRQVSAKDLFETLRPGLTPEGATTYTVAYIAHAPLEPRAAIAEWQDGKLTVWTGTQRPFGVRSELAAAFRVPEDKVRVIMPDMGSGYGGKHSGEAAIEAAKLAEAVKKPVRLVWTREEEFTWAYFRPGGVIDITSAIDANGKITKWEMHNYNSGESGIRSMYDIPGEKTEFHRAPSPLKQGSYRGLAATANHFAREVQMDELAAQAKLDPLAFRLKNIKDERLRGVLEAAAKNFGWGKAKPVKDSLIQHGFGLSCGFEKGSYVASCAEVAIDRTTGKVAIVRVVTAFECGAIVNPDQLKNQVEGSVVQGIGGALFEAIDFADGKILNPRFSKYRVPRFSDVPVLDTVLLDRKDLPSAGAGETPIVGLAPALSNAIFDAVGVRLRSMPMAAAGMKGTAPGVPQPNTGHGRR